MSQMASSFLTVISASQTISSGLGQEKSRMGIFEFWVGASILLTYTFPVLKFINQIIINNCDDNKLPI